MIQNDRLLRALRREKVDSTPIWMMRQAGRYLPEYRLVRARAQSFMSLCKTPELACEVTLQPLRRYDVDAAIIFSDILTIPDAMGCEVNFLEGEGPVLNKPLRLATDVLKLPIIDVYEKLAYVVESVRLIKSTLADRVPLLGFCGSPWTLAAYMVEGRGSREFTLIKKMLYDTPALLQQLLAKLTESCTDLLVAQIQAGADAVMIFDTWGGLLTPQQYTEFSLRTLRVIVANLRQHKDTSHIPVILFSKGRGDSLAALAATGCAAVSIDWMTDLQQARMLVGSQVALQGNLDPAVLLASEQAITAEVAKVLQAYGHGNGHVFNLGHGITPEVAPEKVSVMIQAVRELSPAYHRE